MGVRVLFLFAEEDVAMMDRNRRKVSSRVDASLPGFLRSCLRVGVKSTVSPFGTSAVVMQFRRLRREDRKLVGSRRALYERRP